MGARSEHFFCKNFYSQFTQLVIIVADVVKKPRLWKNPLRTRGTPYRLAAVSSNATSSQFYPSASEWLDPWPAPRAPRPSWWSPILLQQQQCKNDVSRHFVTVRGLFTLGYENTMHAQYGLILKRQYLHNMQVIKSQ